MRIVAERFTDIADAFDERVISDCRPFPNALDQLIFSYYAVALFKQLGITPGQVAQLQAVPMDTLVAAQAAVEDRLDGLARQKGVFEQHGFVPTVGVPTLPAYAFDPVATDVSADSPILIGSNRHELAYASRSDEQPSRAGVPPASAQS